MTSSLTVSAVFAEQATAESARDDSLEEPLAIADLARTPSGCAVSPPVNLLSVALRLADSLLLVSLLSFISLLMAVLCSLSPQRAPRLVVVV